MLSLPLTHGRRWFFVAAELDQNEALKKKKVRTEGRKSCNRPSQLCQNKGMLTSRCPNFFHNLTVVGCL